MRSMHEVQQRRSPERNARSAAGQGLSEVTAFSPERQHAMTTPFRGGQQYY